MIGDEMTDHLPECLTPMYDAKAWCICNELRACEERLREGWCVSTCGNTHYTIGYEEGLNAAREAVADARTWPARVPYPASSGFYAIVIKDDALAAIDALRDQPADQTGYKAPNVRHLAADLIIEYAEARHQPHTPRYDCGRCDLTAALRAAAHDIRRSS